MPRPSVEDRLAAAGLPPLPRTAWAEIDLDALAWNLGVLRRLAPGTPVHPVVKADAYGHGAIPVARALEAAGAEGLCVAALDEALALRRAGITLPLLVLYPIPPALAGAAARDRIALTAGDRALLDALLAGIRAEPPAIALEVQLEVETGLGRGGFPLEGLVRAASDIAGTPGVRLVSAWTHFQAPADQARTAAQVAAFEAATRALASNGLTVAWRHAAASGGLLLEHVVSLDGVRPGLAVYGLVPDDMLGDGPAPAVEGAADLRPVLSLHARPVRVADLPAGWGISYGPSFTTSRPSRIATLPLGYGDGWTRSLSNRAVALVRGQRVPLVGNVAMDAVMADVTDVPGPPVGVNDEFVLLGIQGEERITAAEVARARGTISWEVVTSLSRRLPRVYDAASVPLETRTLVADGVETRRSKRP
ncbi:MAG: alanine racemase [Chloroflexi bacterium]|nr:alanine racemase [Chloroflexota bacterium]